MTVPRHALKERPAQSRGMRAAVLNLSSPSRRTQLWAGAVAAVLAVTAFSITSGERANAATLTQAASGTLVNYQVLAPGSSVVATLPSAPANAVSATFQVTGRWAWRSTGISVCPGTVATDACKASPALVTPVQSQGTATVTVPLASAGGKVVVYNSLASVRATVKLLSYT